MKKTHSLFGLIASLAIHGLLVVAGFTWIGNHPIEKVTTQEKTLSVEIVAALLTQPQVAVAPTSIPEEVKEIKEENLEPEPTSEPETKSIPQPDAIPDPSLKLKQEKPKEKKHRKYHIERKAYKEKKENPEEKLKEPLQRKHTHRPIKALEQGPESKQGIVAKAIPHATQSDKLAAGIVDGQRKGSQSISSTGIMNGTSGGNTNEISAYKAALQRALQRKASNAYPQREKMMRKTGTVTIKFNVLPSGVISNVSVMTSSGNNNLDTAAIRSAEGIKMPSPPTGFPSQVTVPIKFSME